MKTSFKFAMAAASLAVASGALADGLYGEVAYAPLKLSTTVDGLGLSAKPAVVRGMLGLELSPHVALEGMLAAGAKKDNITLAGTNSGVDTKISNMFGVYVKPKLQVGPGLELFGRLGYVRSKLKVADESPSEGSVSYGLGASYSFNPALSLNADYMIYNNKDDVKIDGVSIGLGFKF